MTTLKLTDFEFKEVLGGSPAHKSLFILLQHRETKQPAVLTTDRQALVEEGDVISKWLARTEVVELAVNDVYHSYIVTLPQEYNGIKSTLIYPATDHHIAKYRRLNHVVVYETADDFRAITEPYFKSLNNLAWVYNVLEGKSEADRVVLHDKDEATGFLLAPDIKWNGTDVDTLYLQAIVHRRDLGCVRSLTTDHVPLLENIRDKVHAFVEQKYGLKPYQLRLYLHYVPSYYHLHVHVINVKYDAPASGMSSIPLQEVIDNVKIWPDFYQKATLMFTKRTGDPLIKLFVEAGRVVL